MPIRKIIEGTISADYVQEENGVEIASLTLMRIPTVPPGGQERRDYTYRAGNSAEWGEIPEDDHRADADVVNDVFFTRGKPACLFRRRM